MIGFYVEFESEKEMQTFSNVSEMISYVRKHYLGNDDTDAEIRIAINDEFIYNEYQSIADICETPSRVKDDINSRFEQIQAGIKEVLA